LGLENPFPAAADGRMGSAHFCLDLLSIQGDAAMRLGVAALLAIFLTACSDSTPVAPADATESAAMVEKNCADPQWKDKNLGLWYSVCRQPMHW
jgi:hypothetical protein